MSQPDFATVWGPNGLRTFRQLEPGEWIWSGKKWIQVVRKINVGTSTVFRYNSRMNASFIGTKDHKIKQCKRAVPVGQATYMNSSMWEPYVYYQASEIYMLSSTEEYVGWMIEISGSEHTYWSGGVLALDYRGHMLGNQ